MEIDRPPSESVSLEISDLLQQKTKKKKVISVGETAVLESPIIALHGQPVIYAATATCARLDTSSPFHFIGRRAACVVVETESRPPTIQVFCSAIPSGCPLRRS